MKMNVENLCDIYVSKPVSFSSPRLVQDNFNNVVGRLIPEEVYSSAFLRSIAIESLRLFVLVLVAYIAYKKGAEENTTTNRQPPTSDESPTQLAASQLSRNINQDTSATTRHVTRDVSSLDVTFESVSEQEKVDHRRKKSPRNKGNVEEKDDEDIDRNEVVPPRKILGPSVNSIKFLVSAKPDQHLHVFAPTSYQSIQRLLEINFYNLTCSIHMPFDKNTEENTKSTVESTEAASAKTPTVTLASKHNTPKAKQLLNDPAEDPASRDKFLPGKQFPLSCIVNVNAIHPARGVTLKITVELPEALLQLIPSSTVALSTLYIDTSTAISKFVTHTSIEEGLRLHPSYDVLRPRNDRNDWKMNVEIAKTSGFEEATIPLEDDGLQALAAHGCTVEKSRDPEKTVTTRTETLEFVFQSSHDAALFQYYVFALNLIGKEIRNLYSGLEFVNRTRIAKHLAPHISKSQRDTTEDQKSAVIDAALLGDPSLCIAFFASCSDDTRELLKKLGVSRTHVRGVALDDISRCLCSVPFLEKRIQSIYDAHFPSWRTLEDYERSEVIDSTFYLDSARTQNGHNSAPEKVERIPDTNQTPVDEASSTSVFTAAAQAQRNVEGSSVTPSKRSLTGIIKGRYTLGFVDFIYLFLGDLPIDKTPVATPSAGPIGIKNHLDACRQACVLRKRVARAALFTKHYVDAMRVVVAGWSHQNVDQEASTKDSTTSGKTTQGTDQFVMPLNARLAFDDDLANISHDMQTSNEYYEATVGKDVTCNVHSREHLEHRGHTVKSKIQAYALVGLNVFRFNRGDLAETDIRTSLSPDNDPVLCISSLYQLIKSNSDNVFFVGSSFCEQTQTCSVLVFVRTLPYGVDHAFDAGIKSLKGGTKNPTSVQNQDLELFIQLGPMPQLSSLVRMAVNVVSAYWSWIQHRKGKSATQVVTENERRSFPGIKISRCTTQRHFIGELPNYVSFSSHYNSNYMPRQVSKLLYTVVPTAVIDFSFVLKERALGTVRICKIRLSQVAQPPPDPHNFKQHLTSKRSLAAEDTGGAELAVQEEGISCALDQSALSFVDDDIDSKTSVLTMQKLRDQLDSFSSDGVIFEGASLEEYRGECEALVDILCDIVVPLKRRPVATLNGSESPKMISMPVLNGLNAHDLLRYIVASEFNLKAAAVNIVENAAWRGVTFPVDKRVCRIELESGQFFLQGLDLAGNPVAYFSSTCPGPWRMDVDAQVFAVLHRLESAISYWSRRRLLVQFTLVVLMGTLPLAVGGNDLKRRRNISTLQETPNVTATNAATNVNASLTGHDNNSLTDQISSSQPKLSQGLFNPRIDSDEELQVHGNYQLAERLATLITRHYPERFQKCLVVASGSREAKKVDRFFTHLVSCPRLRDKVTILHSEQELKMFISADELVTFAGGNAVVTKTAFTV